jgi:hypothetical protein
MFTDLLKNHRIFVAIDDHKEQYEACNKSAYNASFGTLVHLFCYEFEADFMEIASNVDIWLYEGYSFSESDEGFIVYSRSYKDDGSEIYADRVFIGSNEEECIQYINERKESIKTLLA